MIDKFSFLSNFYPSPISIFDQVNVINHNTLQVLLIEQRDWLRNKVLY